MTAPGGIVRRFEEMDAVFALEEQVLAEEEGC